MSDAYLVLALLCTFFAVVLVGVAADIWMGDRGAAVRLLEAQVGQAGGSANLRERELSRSFTERALHPLISWASRLAARYTPAGTRGRIAHKLMLAGNPAVWDEERVVAFKIIGGLTGLIAALALGSLAGVSGLTRVGVAVLLVAAGFFLPDATLDRKVRERQRDIRRSLPDVLDLLTISVEAGLSVNAALAQVVRNVSGVLPQELGRMLQEVQLGVARSDALRHLAERTDVEDLNGFVLAMVQAETFGVSISNVLRAQARELRLKRRQRAEREAQETPVKLVFPMILCILPSLFVVVIGPGAIRIFQNFFAR